MSLATTRQRVLFEAREIWRGGFITFDTETTGLEKDDQIIQWAVCDQEANVLGSGHIKPTVPISEGAFAVHGIEEALLVDAPTFAEAWPSIRDLLTGRTVVIYNANFDLGKIWSSARPYDIEIPYDDIKNHICAMELFARFYGEAHEYYGTYTWQKLDEVAIPHLKIEVPGSAHNAVHDAMATALIIKKLAELADQELPPGWHPPVLVKCAGCEIARECAEPDEIWYCQSCGLECGVFHHCPGCNYIVESPATGIPCEYCQQRLHREMMLLTGAWHYCPDSPHHIVQTPDLEEPCESCALQRKWKQQREEAERARQERIERERKEHRRAYQKAYRQERKEREQENRRRAEQGLPPMEQKKSRLAVEEIFDYQGHRFQRRKDIHGRSEVYCLKCEAIWSRPPNRYCAQIKTYRGGWDAIPEHLKTRTQLLKLHLQPAKGQKVAAVIDGAFNRYHLYDKNMCVPKKVEGKQEGEDRGKTDV